MFANILTEFFTVTLCTYQFCFNTLRCIMLSQSVAILDNDVKLWTFLESALILEACFEVFIFRIVEEWLSAIFTNPFGPIEPCELLMDQVA